jgi:HEAT repeat protein
VDRLGLTFDYLATTDNEAATAVLLSSLEHRERTVAEGTVNALLRRKSQPGLDALVRKWHLLGDRLKALPADRPGVLTPSLKVAFLSSDEQLIRNAADAAVTTADYDLATLFAQSVTDPSPLRRRVAAESVLRLAEMLYDELHSSTPGRVRHDPQCIREFIVGSLESPVTRFSQHHSRETLEAFLLLAPRECATLRHLLQDSQEAAHEPLCDQLLRSTRPGVMRLLLSMLDEPHAPLVALRIIGRRRDVGFFRQLCKKLGEDHSPHVPGNLARIDQLDWLDDDALSILTTLSEAEQPGAVVLAVRTKISLSERLRILEQLLAEGRPLGRQAAARALFDTYGKECDWLVQDLIHDPCPLVQAEAARRLRECDVPDAVDILFGLLDSSSAEVRAAARHGLEDYTLKSYLQTIDSLSESERITIGALVKRVDPNLIDELLQEMVVPVRARRLRALQATAALEVAPLVATGLCELARDEYHGVRVEAARLLGECDGSEVRYTLRELQSDSLPAVQREAEQSLELIKKHSLRGASFRPSEASP